MRRRETKAGLEALFARLRDRIPGVVLRTSLITGLPYEDEAAFEELCGFLGEQKLQRARLRKQPGFLCSHFRVQP